MTTAHSACSRRHFLGALAAATAAFDAPRLLAAATPRNNIRLGMMLQAASAAELQDKAKTIASVGFDAVQLTFLFTPTDDEVRALAQTLKDLKLKTVAFGTYFNLFRPDDTTFMGASQTVMKRVATHAGLFDCAQFVTWSGSYASQFGGNDPRNHSAEAVSEMHRAIRDVLLPILEPINGRVAFEPYFPHALGTLEHAKAILTPFPVNRVGLLLDPPNFITPALYPKRDEEMRRLFRILGDRVHLAHFKDLKLSANAQTVDLPGPGGGEMNYPLLISLIRKLARPIPCILEHIDATAPVMSKTKAWVEKQLA
jgi:sugar phosphate isomerase/epimerase